MLLSSRQTRPTTSQQSRQNHQKVSHKAEKLIPMLQRLFKIASGISLSAAMVASVLWVRSITVGSDCLGVHDGRFVNCFWSERGRFVLYRIEVTPAMPRKVNLRTADAGSCFVFDNDVGLTLPICWIRSRSNDLRASRDRCPEFRTPIQANADAMA